MWTFRINTVMGRSATPAKTKKSPALKLPPRGAIGGTGLKAESDDR
jgi:hypothetical protein